MSIISSEAERLYPTQTVDYRGTLAQVYTSDDLQEAYMAGASRKPTDEEIEAAAEAVYEVPMFHGNYGRKVALAVITAMQGKVTEE